MLKHLKPRKEYQLLTSMPGVGKVLAWTIVLETGTIERLVEFCRGGRPNWG